MGLWGELHRVTSRDDALFHGFTDTSMIVMLQELSSHKNVRFHGQGHPVSESQRNMSESSFRDNFNLSSEQFQCIVDFCMIGLSSKT